MWYNQRMTTPDYSKVILHVDANNFYASCECARDPSLRGKPLAVCGDPAKRKGIVLAKSYEAKQFGIKTGDTVYQALKACPDLVLMPPDFALYSHYSKALFAMYTQYTDRVESFGMDECWLDVTGSGRLFGSGKQIADVLRERVKSELNLTVSVGVSFTKVLAKLGSDYRKPDATTVFDRDTYRTLAWALPVDSMIFVGRRTAMSLREIGIRTIGQLAAMPVNVLQQRMGVNGVKLWQAANGIETEEVMHYYDHVIPESISNGTTTSSDINSQGELLSVVTTLSDMVASRLRGYGLRAMSCYVYAKAHDFSGFGGTMKFDAPIGSATEMIDSVLQMMQVLWTEHNHVPLRSVTVGVTRLLGADTYTQYNLFDTTDHDKLTRADASVDLIRARFGKDCIKRMASSTYSYTTDEIVDDSTYRPFKKN